MKKKLSVLLALVMAVVAMSALVACGGGTTPQKTAEEKLVDGRYVYGYTVAGQQAINTTGFFRFYEDAPVAGKVFYAYLAGQSRGGTYTVEKKDFNYSVYFTRADVETDDGKSTANQKTGTASHTVTFYDFNGDKMDEAGFDGDYLYLSIANTSPMYAMGMAPVRFTHDTDADSTYNSIYELEAQKPAVVESFIADDNKTSTLQINHNFKYIDLVDTMVEGSWTVAKDAAGVKTYTLTPSLSTDTGASFVVAADGRTATYTPTGGTAVSMTKDIYYVADVAEFTGKANVSASGYTFGMDFVVTLRDDNSCIAEGIMGGNALFTDKGTWTKKSGKVEFEFDELGKIDAPITKGDDGLTLTATLAAKGAVLAETYTLAEDAVVTGDASMFEAELSYEFTGSGKFAYGEQSLDAAFALKLYDDNTCELEMTMYGQKAVHDSGVWVGNPNMGGYPSTVTFDGAGEKSVSFAGSAFSIEYAHGGATVTLSLAITQ